MKLYEGTKRILATPMNRADYNTYRGWVIPDNENPADDGYLVEYTDGGKPNDSRHAGYISWSPADVFERTYYEIDGLQPYQQRVVKELVDLSEKSLKLCAFFESSTFSALSEAEQSRLLNQARFMNGYEAVLEERIAAFTK